MKNNVGALSVKNENRMSNLKESGEELFMLLPAIILLIVFMIVPFCMSIQLSFTNQRLIQGPIATKFIGLRNFSEILSDDSFWQAFRNIFYFTALVLPIQCGFALFMAHTLNKLKTLKNFLRGLFFLPYITPMVIVAVIWSTILQYPSGILNAFLTFISGGALKPVDWLGSEQTAMLSIAILSSWACYGFQMVIFLAGLQNIPEEQYEAADIEGASGWQKFAKITLPNLQNTTILVLTITTIARS